MINNNSDNKSNNKSHKPELLAPAGNRESFYAVLNAGADAVYLAGNRYGARAYADNFSEEELCNCIKYAHLYNRKVYLTVNTLVTNQELNNLHTFLKPMYECGLDGVIVQDLGVITYIRRHFPDMEVHASTQLNCTGTNGATLLRNMGVCRVVPARELSLNELKTLKNETGLELECFIHGAICYCYSGQCLFSSVIGGRSGNRGRCAQPCRLPYNCGDGTEKYPLSLKDMCTIEFFPELIKAGIDSFKIEGRMKKPEYAAGVTALYRKYIDQYYTNGSVKVSTKDRRLLESLYIRSEISEGYYERYNGADMITLDSPSYNGADDETLNKIRNKYIGDDAQNALPKYSVQFTAYFMTGEQAVLNAECNDITVTVYGDIVQSAQKKPITPEDISKQLCRLGNTVFEIDNFNTEYQVFASDDAYYNLKGINELRREAIRQLEEALIKSYGLSYSRECPDIFANGTIDYAENDLYRRANARRHCETNILSGKNFNISINDAEQFKVLIDLLEENDLRYIPSRIYVPEELFITLDGKNIESEMTNYLVNTVKYINDYLQTNIELFISMPYVRRMRDKHIVKMILQILNENDGIAGVLVRNIDDMYLLLENNSENAQSNRSESIKIAGDYGLYAWNESSMHFFEEYLDSIGLPIELCGAAQREISGSLSEFCYAEKMIYGRIPLMHSANCVNKTLGNCYAGIERTNDMRWTSIVDRTKRKIPIFTDCTHCQNTIYNAVPLTLDADSKSNSYNTVFRIDLTDEDENMTERVLLYYLSSLGQVTWEYTKGFEKRSTE